MKKFLCYDTNDAASGKIGVNSNGVLKPNSTVPSTNGASYQQLVTDSDGNTKWEDRLAYDDSRIVVGFGNGAQMVKVSDEVPSWVSLDAPIKYWGNNGEKGTVSPEDFVSIGNESFLADGMVFIMADNVEFNGHVFPEKGVYFALVNSVDFPSSYVSGIASVDSDTPEITWDGNIDVIKKLDKKFIPSELNEIILPSSTSGSSKKFKITIDDSGTISATEV